MPIGLEMADCHASEIAGRVVFVVDLVGTGTAEVVAALRTLPGIGVPDGPSDFVVDGLIQIGGNYLAGQTADGGISALSEERPFLLAVRALGDAVYSSALARNGAEIIVDASPSNAITPQVIGSFYPDATIVLIDDGSNDVAELLTGPLVCRITPDQLTGDPSALAALIAPVVERARTEAAQLSRPAAAAPSTMREGQCIFVVGVPRSGTTWLQHLLAAHPAIGGPQRETAIFESLRPLRDNVARPPTEGIAGWIDEDALLAAMRVFCDAMFAESLASSGTSATWLLEKTPMHGSHLDTIATLYPDVWVISIYRDGRDVTRSLVDLSFGFDDYTTAARVWRSLTTLIERTGPLCPRFRNVRYEDLLADTDAMTAELLAWVGLPADADVKRTIAARAGERVSRYNTSGDVGAGKWTELRAADVRAIYRHAGDRLVALGYLAASELAAIRSRPGYRVAEFGAALKSLVRPPQREVLGMRIDD